MMMAFLKSIEKVLLILTVFILVAGCDTFDKEGGSFSVKFNWPENGKPDFSEGYSVWIEMQEWIDGDIEDMKVHLKEGPVSFSTDGKAQFSLKDLSYGKNRVILVEVRKSESEQDRTLYYGVSKLFDLEPQKNTDVSVEMNITATPGTENGKSSFSISIVKDSEPVDKVAGQTVSIRINKAVGEKVVFSNRLELLDVQVNDLERDYTGAEVIEFSTLTELSDDSFQYDGWDLLEGREENAQGDGEKVLYAKIIDERGYRSEMAYTSAVLDTIAPEVINVAVSPAGTPGMANIGTDIIVRFMLSEPVEEFNFDGNGLEFTDSSSGENKIFTYKVTDSDEDGATYDFKVSAKDEAGNELSDYALGSVKIDSTVPEIVSFSVSKEKVRMGEEFSVEIEVSEELKSLEVLVGAKSISNHCKLKGDSSVNYICTHTANVDGDEGDGVKQVAVQIVDLADNPNSQTLKEDSEPVTIEYDITSPILASGVILPPVVNKSSETVSAKFSFVEKVSFTLDDIDIQPETDLVFDCGDLSETKASYECTATFNNDDERVADYTFSISVQDEVGNASENVDIGTISVDRLAPYLTEQSISPQSLKMGESFTVTFEVSEELMTFPVVRVGEKIIPESSCSYSSTSGEYSCTHQANIDGDENDGIKAISAYIVDKAGNAATETFNDSVSYDATAPVLISPVVIPSLNINSYNDEFQVRFSFSEKVKSDDSFKFSVVTESGDEMTNDFTCESPAGDNQTFSCKKEFEDDDSSQGSYTFYVDAYDLSGNRLPQDGILNKITTILVDRKVPVVEITSILPLEVNSETEYVDVTFSVGESVGVSNPVVRMGSNIERTVPYSENTDRTEFVYRFTGADLQRVYDGSQKIYVEAEDTFGNIGESDRQTVQVDRTLPTVVDSTLNRLKAKKDDDIIVTVTFSEEMNPGSVKLEDDDLGLALDAEASSDQIYVYKYRVQEKDNTEARQKSYAVTIVGDDVFGNRINPVESIGSVELDLTPPASVIKNFSLTTATSSFYDIGGIPAASAHQPDIEFSFSVVNVEGSEFPDVSIGYEPAATVSCSPNGADLDCTGTYHVSGGESEGTKMVGIFLNDDVGNIAEHYPGAVVFDFTGPVLVSTIINRVPDYAPAKDSDSKIQYLSPKDPFTEQAVKIQVIMFADEQIDSDSDVLVDNLPCITEPFSLSDDYISGNSITYYGSVEECAGTYIPTVTWSDMLGNESEGTSDWLASVIVDYPDPLNIDRSRMLFTRKPLGSIDEGSTPVYSVNCDRCVRSDDIAYLFFYTETGLLAGSGRVDSRYSTDVEDLVGGDVPLIYVNPVSYSGNKIPIETASGDPFDIPSVLDPVPNVVWTMNMNEKTVGMSWPNPSSFYNEKVETGVLPAVAQANLYIEKRNAVDPGSFSDDPYNYYKFFHSGYGHAFNSSENELTVFGGTSFSELLTESHYYADLAVWNGHKWLLPEIEGMKPESRTYASMVFEEARNQYVLFGGGKYTGSWEFFDDTWIFDGEYWTRLFIAGPSERQRAAMAYDPQREVTVLIGGTDTTNPIADTSTWEFDGVSWREPALSDPESDGNPVAGYGNMVYHPVMRKMIYHNGYTGYTWAYNGDSWELLNSAGPICKGAGMVYEHVNRSILLYGGKDGASYLASAYRFDGQNWTGITSIDPISDHVMWYSHTDKATYVTGGTYGEHIYPQELMKIHNEEISKESPYISSNARMAMCYNSNSDKIYYFGGQRYIESTGIWSDDSSFGTIDGKYKEELAFSTGPSVMSNHDIVYYPEEDTVVVLDDTNLWQYDGSSWSIRDSGGPGNYDNYKMIYDPAHSEILLVLITPPKEGDGEVQTWTYNGTVWTQETSSTQPSVNSQNGVALTYLSTTSRVYAFAFSPLMPATLQWNGSSWSNVSVTDPELDGSPESSDYAVFVTSEDNKLAILINRNSSSGQLEFWRFNGSSYSKLDFTEVTTRYAFDAVYSSKDQGVYIMGGKKYDDENAGPVEDWYFIKIPRQVVPKQKYEIPLSYASIPENSVIQKIDVTWIGGGTTVSDSTDINGYRLDTWISGGWETAMFSTGSYDEHSSARMSITDPDVLDLMPASVDQSIGFKAYPLLIDGFSENIPEMATSGVEVDVYYNTEGNRKLIPEIRGNYYFSSTPMTWQDARDYCLDIGFDLLIIGSEVEQNLIVNADYFDKGDYWIGVNDIFEDGDWRNVNGTAFWSGGYKGSSMGDEYSNWDSEFPRSSGVYNCGYILEDGTWADDLCSSSRKFICEFRTSPYVVSTDKKTWTLASDRCTELSLSLAKIDGSIEQNNISGRFAGTTDVWIGYSDAGVEGEWRWMSGLLGWEGTSSGTSYYYNNWGKFYPLSSSDRDYAYMEMAAEGQWRNAQGTDTKRYVCKKDTSEQICYLNGGSCSENSECCSEMCSDNYGTCVSCLENGDSTCTEPSDCCGNICNTVSGECAGCLNAGEYTCSSYKDCCSTDHSCISGKCCKGFGLSCTSGSECCSSYACGYASECRRPYGAYCKLNDDCSTNVCAKSSCSCYPVETACTDNNECCSYNCYKGTCQCAENFGRCIEDSDCCSKNCNRGICIP